MNDHPLRLDVVMQCYRDMVCMGEEETTSLLLGGVNRVQMPPGGVQMNAASVLVVSIDYLERFIHGWYTGMASMQFDNLLIGHPRPFQFCIHNDDAPSVVHFKPCAFLVGWWPSEQPSLEQHIYSFAIRPYRAPKPDVSRETEG